MPWGFIGHMSVWKNASIMHYGHVLSKTELYTTPKRFKCVFGGGGRYTVYLDTSFKLYTTKLYRVACA